MSFPTIFCGKNRAENKEREVNVSYGDICKSELRNVDGRVASYIPKIFFTFKKLQTKSVLNKMNICLRKKPTKNKRSICWLFKKFRQYSKFMQTG